MRRPYGPILGLVALVACAPALPSAASPRWAELERALRARIAATAGDSAEVAVAVFDLARGDSLLLAGHTPMHAASTMKVGVLYAALRQVDAGALRLDSLVEVRTIFRSLVPDSVYTLDPSSDSDPELYRFVGRRVPLHRLLERMIVRSSNLATNLLVERLGAAAIQADLEAIGAREMQVRRGVEDGPAYRRGLNNTTTAYGFAKVLVALATGRGLSRAMRDTALAILARQEFRERVPAGLPPGVWVGNKTGDITRIAHDGAIVWPAGRAPYVLVVLTRGFADVTAANALARDVSSLVYRALVAGAGTGAQWSRGPWPRPSGGAVSSARWTNVNAASTASSRARP